MIIVLSYEKISLTINTHTSKLNFILPLSMILSIFELIILEKNVKMRYDVDLQYQFKEVNFILD